RAAALAGPQRPVAVEQPLQEGPHQVRTRPQDPVGDDLTAGVVPEPQSCPEVPPGGAVPAYRVSPVKLGDGERQAVPLRDDLDSREFGRRVELQLPRVTGC